MKIGLVLEFDFHCVTFKVRSRKRFCVGVFCDFYHKIRLGEMAVLEQYHTGTIRLMGTVIELKIAHPEGERLVAEVFEQLKRYEHRFSANDPTSELMAVNLAAGKHAVCVHPEIFHLVK